MQAADLNLTLKLLLPKLPHHGPVVILTIGLIKPILRISATMQIGHGTTILTIWLFAWFWSAARSGQHSWFWQSGFCCESGENVDSDAILESGYRADTWIWLSGNLCQPLLSDNRVFDLNLAIGRKHLNRALLQGCRTSIESVSQGLYKIFRKIDTARKLMTHCQATTSNETKHQTSNANNPQISVCRCFVSDCPMENNAICSYS